MIIVGIDPGKTSGAAVVLSVGGPLHLIVGRMSWRTWDQMVEAVRLIIWMLREIEGVVWQCEDTFFRPLRKTAKGWRGSNPASVADVNRSIGAWHLASSAKGGIWLEPVRWSEWAPAVCGRGVKPETVADGVRLAARAEGLVLPDDLDEHEIDAVGLGLFGMRENAAFERLAGRTRR